MRTRRERAGSGCARAVRPVNGRSTRVPMLIILVCLAPCAETGEATSAAGEAEYRLALPGYRYEFPRDHGSHDRFRTEWWYFTGHLDGRDGRRLGYELTFFRRAVRPRPPDAQASRWAIHQVYLAHFAISDLHEDRFLYAEKVSRAALGKAGAEPGGLKVWIDRWSAKAVTPDHGVLSLQAATDGFEIALRLTPMKPPVIHGLEGVSRKGAGRGRASHYYSFTRLETAGTVRVGTETLPVTGTSWMDHEFGSADLGEDQVGWDWFSIQLEDRTEFMFYRLRRLDGAADPASSGTFITAGGRARHLTTDGVTMTVRDHWVSRESGARYPSGWRLEVPSLDLSLTVSPLMANQELITGKSTQVTYWEGAVSVEGTREGAPVRGQGYVELTGYAERLDRRL